MDVYCDFRDDGGGGRIAWTLVMLNNKGTSCPGYGGTYASWDNVVNKNIIGAHGHSTHVIPNHENYPRKSTSYMKGFAWMVGLRYWNALGDTLMIEMGSFDSSHNRNIVNRAETNEGDFGLNQGQDYMLKLESMTVTKGTTKPNLYWGGDTTKPNGAKFSTYDKDNGSWPNGSCVRNYNNGPWWYRDCSDALFWGDCLSSGYGPMWTDNHGNNQPHAAIWVRCSGLNPQVDVNTGKIQSPCRYARNY